MLPSLAALQQYTFEINKSQLKRIWLIHSEWTGFVSDASQNALEHTVFMWSISHSLLNRHFWNEDLHLGECFGG